MKKKKKISYKKLTITIMMLLSIITNSYLIYTIYLLSGIETIGRYLFISLLFLIDLLIFTEWIKFIKRKRKNRYYSIFNFLLIIYLFFNIFVGFFINKIYSSIDNVSKEYVTHSTSLVVMKNSSVNNIKDVLNLKIGIIKDKESLDGYIISQEIIKENKLSNNIFIEYEGFATMLVDLYDKKIDAIFISSSYANMFSSIEKFTNISSETKSIVSKNKIIKKETIISGKKLNEPFSILLMGVDSEKDGLDSGSASNGDALIFITFNPNTAGITMVSIPRDSYIPITCFKNKIENKITHAAWQGTDCMIKTVENFFDIPVDYHIKINFKGVVSLVNSLGGITVDVPQNLCTGDSNRLGTICINKGLQVLNGEQALVLSRNRHQLSGGDLDREKNQQLIIKAIIEKLKSIRDINQITNILNTISKNIDTNFSTDQILSFYNIGKETLINNNNEIAIESLLLQGNGQMIYDENMGLVLWNYILNKDSVNAVINEMKFNLNLKNNPSIKTFEYSIDNPYLKVQIGSEYTKGTYYSIIPDFKNYTQVQAKKWLNTNGFNITYTTRDSNEKTGTIIGQSIPAFKRMDKINNKNITLYISSKIVSNETVEDEKDEKIEDVKKNK